MLESLQSGESGELSRRRQTAGLWRLTRTPELGGLTGVPLLHNRQYLSRPEQSTPGCCVAAEQMCARLPSAAKSNSMGFPGSPRGRARSWWLAVSRSADSWPPRRLISNRCWSLRPRFA